MAWLNRSQQNLTTTKRKKNQKKLRKKSQKKLRKSSQMTYLLTNLTASLMIPKRVRKRNLLPWI